MNNIIMKLVAGELITDSDIADELYDICERCHSSCDSECPVCDINGDTPPDSKGNNRCDCYRDGMAMLKFIRNKLKVEKGIKP
jgi:hypothetical protein